MTEQQMTLGPMWEWTAQLGGTNLYLHPLIPLDTPLFKGQQAVLAKDLTHRHFQLLL